ncbi:MAG: hypothetical protein IJP64_00595 [Oscillospiraceae bacterium]|nr:hypothetical protein [Oscillospiraceae bacterium]
MLGKFELDIYLPDERTAVEYDGIEWHKRDDTDKSLLFAINILCPDKQAKQECPTRKSLDFVAQFVAQKRKNP